MEKKLSDYYRSEHFSTLFIIIAGFVLIAFSSLAIFVYQAPVYYGIMTCIVPFGIVMVIQNIPNYIRVIKINQRLKISKNGEWELVAKHEINYIQSEISNYERNNLIFSGILVIGILTCGLCFITIKQSFLLGIAVGLCVVSALLLAHHLFVSFRKKLFVHELKKILNQSE